MIYYLNLDMYQKPAIFLKNASVSTVFYVLFSRTTCSGSKSFRWMKEAVLGKQDTMYFLIWFYIYLSYVSHFLTFLLDNSSSSFFSIIGVQKMAFVIEHVCKSMNSALTIYAEKTIHLPSIYILSLANISDRP